MGVERLVAMANDIGHYFAAEEDRTVAVAGIAAVTTDNAVGVAVAGFNTRL